MLSCVASCLLLFGVNCLQMRVGCCLTFVCFKETVCVLVIVYAAVVVVGGS